MAASDLSLERLRRDAERAAWAPPAAPGSAAMVGKVTTAAPAVGKFLLVNPVRVLGAEAEGGAATLAVDTSVAVPVYLVGPGTPATGDLLVCRLIDYRWAAVKGLGCVTTVTGHFQTCQSTGNTPLPGARVTVLKHSDGSTLATATSDASGDWSATVRAPAGTAFDVRTVYGTTTTTQTGLTANCGTRAATTVTVTAPAFQDTPRSTDVFGTNPVPSSMVYTDSAGNTFAASLPPTSPPYTAYLPAGTYTLRASAPGFADFTGTVTPVSGGFCGWNGQVFRMTPL